MKSYYRALLPNTDRSVPWKCIWKTKALPRVAFFVWAAALGHILTTDNLRRRHLLCSIGAICIRKVVNLSLIFYFIV